jgi:hypothetical protein
VNSTIFGIVNSVILAIVNSTILAAELSHFMILSAILLENSVIPRCYSTQSFLLQCSVILCFATVSSVIFVILTAIFHCYSELDHFVYSELRHFATVLIHFLKLFSHFRDRYSAQSFAKFLSHLLNCSVIFVCSGMRGSAGVARGSIGYACGTELRRAREVMRGCEVE